jgi:GcrA cell cycle regulator
MYFLTLASSAPLLPIKVKEPEVEFIPIPPVEKAPSKAGQNVSLTDLDNHTCRWPIGDPKDDNFHFCGNKVRIGQTYCDEHAAIAYVKRTKK